MSIYDYRRGQAIAMQDEPFYALIQAAMRQADTDNHERLRLAFPDVHAELERRYWAPGGFLPGETPDGL